MTSTITRTTPPISSGFCQGCAQKLDAWSLAFGYSVCGECTKTRARAAMTHRCTCGKKRREVIIDYGHRKVINCDRCLGTYKQLN